MKNEKIGLKFWAYDHKILDQSIVKIINVAEASGAKVIGPIPLPTDRHVQTVLRSVHKHKDSREQFEMREHKRIIYISDYNAKTIDQLFKVQLPSGIKVKVKSKL